MAVTAPEGPLVPLRREIAEPTGRLVRVDVAACGVCSPDVRTAAAGPDSTFPVVPGHEIAGTIAAIGPDVSGWQLLHGRASQVGAEQRSKVAAQATRSVS